MTTLATSLAIAPSQLYVRDLEKMTKFYRDLVGLEVLEQSNSRVLLGHDSTGIVELVLKTKLEFAPPTTAGLFHNAILHDSRGTLSETVLRTLQGATPLYQGTGNHLVSEAFYFADPEGNGLELYYDLPKSEWKWVNGHVQMDTLYIDPQAYLAEHLGDSKNQQRKIGHVHLRVGDITTAKAFYATTLGFDITAELPGALFVSVAGYHHHIGLNTWQSAGASQRVPTLGLSQITLHIAQQQIDNLATRLENSGLVFSYKNGSLTVDDPWSNKLLFVAK